MLDFIIIDFMDHPVADALLSIFVYWCALGVIVSVSLVAYALHRGWPDPMGPSYAQHRGQGMEFVRLYRHDACGHQFLNTSEDSMQEALVFKMGDRVRVRYPDGSVFTHKIGLVKSVKIVHEQGSPHPEQVTSDIPGVFVRIYGMDHWVALDKLEVAKDDLPEPEMMW